MATATGVDNGLDNIAASIDNSRKMFEKAKASIQVARNQLLAIPTTFEDAITEINGYAGEDVFEQVAQARLARYTTEFVTLQAEMDALINAEEF